MEKVIIFKNTSQVNIFSNNENDDKYCSIASILASLHPCENTHTDRISIYRQKFNEINLERFDFIDAFKCSNVKNFEKIYSLSIKNFELSFY